MTTSSQDAQQPAPARSEPPPWITQVAADAGLGDFHALREDRNPVTRSCGLLVVFSLPLLLDIALAAITGEAPRGRLTGTALGILLIGVVASVAILARGFSQVYLFRNGLIRSKNTRLHVVPWQHVREIKLWRAGGRTLAGKLLGYYVMERNGRKVVVDARMKDGRDEFGETLHRLAAAAGIPVVEGGPAVGELHAK